MWYNTIVGGEKVKWYEFAYNAPYHQMTMQEKLRYEDGDDSLYEEFYDIKWRSFEQEEIEWNSITALELKI